MKKSHDDINALGKRIDEFKQLNATSKPKALTNTGIFAKAFLLGTEFLSAVFIGFGLGFLIDRLFGTKFVFIIVMTMFGCAAGVLNMYRSAKEMDNEIEK